MFRKFLVFGGFLLTLWFSQQSFAASIAPIKVVVERGNDKKLNLSFTLDNISPEDAKAYGLSADGTAEEGQLMLTRYLDICFVDSLTTECVAGSNPKKVPYIANSEQDTTTIDQRLTDASASFPPGGTTVEFQDSDTSTGFQVLTTSIDIVATGSRTFSDQTFISIRLPYGKNTSPEAIDAFGKGSIAVPVADVVDSLQLRPSKATITAIWSADEQLDYADNTKATAEGAIAFQVVQGDWDKFFIPLHSYAVEPANEKTIPNSCKVVDSGDGVNCTLECKNTDESAIEPGGHYLKDTDLTAAGIPFVSGPNSGSLSINDLSEEFKYAIVFQNKPDGLRQKCMISQPSDAVMMSELGGGPEPEARDPRCFIATAAYGSSLDPHLNSLRWFRDHALMITGGGVKLVQLYYRYSPPLADFIATHPTLRAVTRGALWLPVLLIETWRERPSMLLTLSAMAGTFFLLFLRRRSLRASV